VRNRPEVGCAPPRGRATGPALNADLYSTLRYGTTTPVRTSGARALVLGGGGAAGNAWVIGVLAGLSGAGLAVTHADLIIGTSAGSTAAAQVTGSSLTDLFATTIAPVPHRPPGGRPPSPPPVNHQERTLRIVEAAEGPADMRRRLGAAALEQPEVADDAWRERWRAVVAARLPGTGWPDCTLLVTAVDARTGEPVVFDRDSGVDLVDAVAASCSSGPPYRIGDHWFIDGGYRRSSENADLAAGCERVLVLSPFGGRTRAPMGWNMHLAAQVDELRTGGSRVEAILPDGAALEAFGEDMMDLSRRAPAARAGYDQGTALAGRLADFWS
jgi:NTE family protein